MEFTTHTNHHKHIDVSFNGLEKFLKENKKIDFFEINEIDPYAVVNWTFYTEARSWGIKSVGVYANTVKLSIDVELAMDESHNEYKSRSFDLSVDIMKFEVNTNDQRNIDSVLTVQEVEFDFDNKEINVTF